MASATYPSLQDRTVVVTGGASGIGEAIVRRFVAQGSHVGFLDIDVAAAEKLVSELPASQVTFENRDLRDVAAIRAGIDAIRHKFGPITVLINNAARDDRHDMDSVTSEYWDERLAANLKHQFFAAQAVAPDMRAAGYGAIVNMGSVSWMIGQGGMPAYTTAKSAVQGLTRSLARDLGPHNIRVNAVVPGWIMTQRQIDLWLNDESYKELLARQCLKRKLYPDDVAKVVLFFASDEAGACTNQSYVVDGGWV
jgi:NAD(P)-dependent dehydrogenase (short-subunit alcohol dehydrogenase family)